MTKRAKSGRPKKAPTPGTRVSLGLKVTPQTKAALDKSAERHGRTQSQEAEVRLESTFRSEHLLDEALTLGYGRGRAFLLRLIATAMDDVISTAPIYRDPPPETVGDLHDWLENPFAYEQMCRAINEILDVLRPDGPVKFRVVSKKDPESLGVAMAHVAIIDAVLELLIDPEMAKKVASGEAVSDEERRAVRNRQRSNEMRIPLSREYYSAAALLSERFYRKRQVLNEG